MVRCTLPPFAAAPATAAVVVIDTAPPRQQLETLPIAIVQHPLTHRDGQSHLLKVVPIHLWPKFRYILLSHEIPACVLPQLGRWMVMPTLGCSD